MVKHIMYKDSIYNNHYEEDYPVQVAENLFINKNYYDTIFKAIANSELKNKGRYEYSDLGFILLYKMIEDNTNGCFYDRLITQFYAPLGATTLGYLPLNRFPKERIVPTENDIVFRRQLVHGHVHDPGAAMLGGICGHAGLFSNANDLAKLMQMYLEEGRYGGTEIFQPPNH
ncbi:MAG: serine hydrolase [Bacteroidales bacterium]|nr:serine hydrolase [Bacteroidales bacterium]